MKASGERHPFRNLDAFIYDAFRRFWFFEARENPEMASLSLWFNGGPGSSSMVGLFQVRITLIYICAILSDILGTWSLSYHERQLFRGLQPVFLEQRVQHAVHRFTGWRRILVRHRECRDFRRGCSRCLDFHADFPQG